MKVLPTKWRRKPAGIDMERNYVSVTLCIHMSQVFSARAGVPNPEGISMENFKVSEELGPQIDRFRPKLLARLQRMLVCCSTV